MPDLVLLPPVACPACGGPVSVASGATQALCHYCNTILRVAVAATSAAAGAAQASAPVVTADASVTPETVARVKQALLAGKRDEAIDLYAREASVDRAAAETAIDGLAQDEAYRTLRQGRLVPVGMFLALALAAMLVGGPVGLAMGLLTTGLGLGAGALGLLGMFWLGPSAVRTIRYVAATAGTATVVRSAFIGKNGPGDSFFRLLVDVRDRSGATFRVERPIVLRPGHEKDAQAGASFKVKFFPGRPDSVLYDGSL